MIRCTAYFSGHVQGVGFRYTTIRIAAHYNVVGFVQNLPDRRVLVVAEGEVAELDAFVKEILQQVSGCVSRHTVDHSDASGEFGRPGVDAFSVRY